MSGATPVAARDLVVERANAYRTLSLALAAPAEWTSTHAQDLFDGLSPLGGDLEERAAALMAAATAAMDHRAEIEVSHARLFVGPFEMKAAPWASLYLDRDQRLMGEASQYAAHAYAEAGLGPGSELKDAPDHIAHELEFIYFLAFQEATTGEAEWRVRQRRFWADHLGRWLPEFARAIQRAEAGAYFEAVGDVLLAFAAMEEAFLNEETPSA